MVGFEPTLSGPPNRRIPRLSYILRESVQGDLNPRIHHGKVAGCQATSWTRFVASSGGWSRTSGLPVFSGTLLPSELHRNMSEPAVGVEPTRAALRERCSAHRAAPACSILVRNRTSSSTFGESRASVTPRGCRIATKLRGLESSQHLRVQSPPSCR